MPHRKAFHVPGGESGPGRIGAIVVAAISTAVLGGAMLLAGRGRSSVDVAPDSQAVVMRHAGARTFVTGRVLDADGGPVGGSAVRVRSDGRPGWDWVTSSGSDGSFQVNGVAAGQVRVAAQDVEAGFVESPPLDANAARGVILVLDRTVEVSGVVLDDRGAPIARAAIECAGKRGAPARIVIADEDGRFALRGAARDVERLTVWARGFEAATVGTGDVASGAIERNVRLHAARPLRGFTVDPLGRGVAFARVSACAGKEAEAAMSDGAGAFQLPATVMGCSVTASHPRFSGTRPTRIGDGRDLVLRLGAGGAIEGTALDERGKPIGLFSVTIASFEAQEETAGALTRAGEIGEHLRGAFRLDDLAPGTYVLKLGAEGRMDAQSRPIEVARGRVIRGEQIVLARSEEDDTPASSSEETTEDRPGDAPSESEPAHPSD